MIVRWAAILGWAIGTAMAVSPAEPYLDTSLKPVTRPSKDPTLSFVRAGQIAEVVVKEGDVVQVGQLLVRQDDAAEQVRLERLKAQADDTTMISVRQAELDQKKLDLEKLKDLFKRNAATDWEVRGAALSVDLAQAKLDLANLEHKQSRREHKEMEIQVQRMKLTSPIAGKVEEIFVQEGESVNELEEVVKVVAIDPLWVKVPVPLGQSEGLKNGQPARVEFIGSSGEIREGKIIHVGAVADAASDTLTVRVEVPNPSGRPAGERVRVSFPAFVETTRSQEDNPKGSDVFQDHTNKE